MKGLVSPDPPADTRIDGQTVEAVGPLTEEGIGVVIPREESYAGVSIDYPSDQENIYQYIKVPRHSAAMALDKIERSSYEQVGKPPIFGRPHYRRAFTINAKTLSISQDSLSGLGTVGKVAYDTGMKIARGLQMALADGANIEVPSAAPLGSQRQVDGYSPVALDNLYTR